MFRALALRVGLALTLTALMPAMALLLACAGPPPDPPSAVIAHGPPTICEGDAHHTGISLDGRSSSSHLTLVPVAPEPGELPLAFSWTISGAEHRIVTGALSENHLTVTSLGDRPLHVQLVVTNGAGGVATAVRTVSLTPAVFTRCTADADCAAGHVCPMDLGRCVPAGSCTLDADCEACFSCDAASMRCVPRGTP